MIICHLTSVHSHNDTRIFLKECSSLEKAGFDVNFVVPGVKDSINNNIKIHGVEKGEGNRFKRMTKTVSKVYKTALEVDADIYHFHDPELLPIGNKLRKKGKKVIYDAHEDLPRAILSKHWIPKLLRETMSYAFEKYENSVAKKMSYVLTATPYIEERFLKVNNKTLAINNFPLLEELTVRENISKKKQICYLGGLTQIRGLEELILVSREIEVPLVIAGPIGDLESEKRIKAEQNITYLGVINRLEAAKLLSESLAGIVTFLPEPNHINAQPNKLFEYMSASLPIIGSDFPLWKEIIEGNNCGICVNPLSVEEIVKSINKIVANEEESVKMGIRGRQAVESKYNWEQEEKKLFKVYESL